MQLSDYGKLELAEHACRDLTTALDRYGSQISDLFGHDEQLWTALQRIRLIGAGEYRNILEPEEE